MSNLNLKIKIIYMEKTNVMRKLDSLKIAHNEHFLGDDKNAISGVEVANILHQDVNRVFKTLVTVAKSNNHYVFMVPVAEELDLKKAAASVHEKSLEMLHQKDLLPLTGYVHGGCSPIGMKKQFKTVIHNTAANFETIYFSAGKIGYQVELPYSSLQKVIRIEMADIIKE